MSFNMPLRSILISCHGSWSVSCCRYYLDQIASTVARALSRSLYAVALLFANHPTAPVFLFSSRAGLGSEIGLRARCSEISSGSNVIRTGSTQNIMTSSCCRAFGWEQLELEELELELGPGQGSGWGCEGWRRPRKRPRKRPRRTGTNGAKGRAHVTTDRVRKTSGFNSSR